MTTEDHVIGESALRLTFIYISWVANQDSDGNVRATRKNYVYSYAFAALPIITYTYDAEISSAFDLIEIAFSVSYCNFVFVELAVARYHAASHYPLNVHRDLFEAMSPGLAMNPR